MESALSSAGSPSSTRWLLSTLTAHSAGGSESFPTLLGSQIYSHGVGLTSVPLPQPTRTRGLGMLLCIALLASKKEKRSPPRTADVGVVSAKRPATLTEVFPHSVPVPQPSSSPSMVQCLHQAPSHVSEHWNEKGSQTRKF